jgi:hypothetical protein
MERLGKAITIGVAAVGLAAVGIAARPPSKASMERERAEMDRTWNKLYETHTFQLDPEVIKQMGETRGKMDASIGCYVDLDGQKIICHVPREKGPWRGPTM